MLPDAFIVIAFVPALPDTSAIVNSSLSSAGGRRTLVGPDADIARKASPALAVIEVAVVFKRLL